MTGEDQGGDDGGNRRGMEQKESSWTQATAMMLTHGGAKEEVPEAGSEPNGACWTEPRGAARGEESRGDGGSTPDQGGAGGTRDPGGVDGSMGDSGGEGARS